MKKPGKKVVFIIIAVIAAAAVGAAVWFYIRNRDERLIRENLDVLAGIAAKSANETAVMNAAKLSRPDKVFASAVKVEAAEYGVNRTYSDKDCAKALAFLHRYYKSVEVSLDIHEIKVDGDKALVQASIRLRSTGGARPLPQLLKALLEYRKMEDKWRVTGVKILPLLQK